MKNLLSLFLRFLTLIFSNKSLVNNSKINELNIRADQGNAEAQFYLGVIYEKGIGVEQSFCKAKELYEKSCKSGYQKSCNNYKYLKLKSY